MSDIENLDSYFRYLYRIIKIVNKENLSISLKKEYVTILRAQLSRNELLLLFYNGILEEFPNMKEFMIEYNLLNNLRVSALPLKMDILFYPLKAYNSKQINIARENESYISSLLELQEDDIPEQIHPYIKKSFQSWASDPSYVIDENYQIYLESLANKKEAPPHL